MEAGWPRRSAPRVSVTSKRRKKSSSPMQPRCLSPSSPSCAAIASSLLPGGDGTNWNYVQAVCATGDGDRSHRIAQGMCTRIVLALAGRDAVNFWRRPIAAHSTRTFIMSSPARRRRSARRGQPLATALSKDGRAASSPLVQSLWTDCFTVYRKERRWCGVQRFSRMGVYKGFLSDLDLRKH